MSKKVLYALTILGISVVVLIINARGGRVAINLLFDTISPLKSIAFLVFMAIGVAIGALLK